MATPRKSAKKVSKKSASKSSLIFPVGRIGTMLRKGRYSKRVSRGAATFLAASLEFLTSEVVELASKTVKGKRITPRAINLAVRHDADLGALLQNVTISRGGVVGSGAAKKAAKKAKKSKKSKAGKKVAKK